MVPAPPAAQRLALPITTVSPIRLATLMTIQLRSEILVTVREPAMPALARPCNPLKSRPAPANLFPVAPAPPPAQLMARNIGIPINQPLITPEIIVLTAKPVPPRLMQSAPITILPVLLRSRPIL